MPSLDVATITFLVCGCGKVSPFPADDTERLYNVGWRLCSGDKPLCPKCAERLSNHARRRAIARVGIERVIKAERILRDKHRM